jgi:hypothetical protein
MHDHINAGSITAVPCRACVSHTPHTVLRRNGNRCRARSQSCAQERAKVFRSLRCLLFNWLDPRDEGVAAPWLKWLEIETTLSAISVAFAFQSLFFCAF